MVCPTEEVWPRNSQINSLLDVATKCVSALLTLAYVVLEANSLLSLKREGLRAGAKLVIVVILMLALNYNR